MKKEQLEFANTALVNLFNGDLSAPFSSFTPRLPIKLHDGLSSKCKSYAISEVFDTKKRYYNKQTHAENDRREAEKERLDDISKFFGNHPIARRLIIRTYVYQTLISSLLFAIIVTSISVY